MTIMTITIHNDIVAVVIGAGTDKRKNINCQKLP